jgi:4-hydroxy-tetrahydrodipicolinate synthase
MATQDGASALPVFSPTPFTLGQSPQMALAHFKRIADDEYGDLISLRWQGEEMPVWIAPEPSADPRHW